jgi:hypothetical protein
VLGVRHVEAFLAWRIGEVMPRFSGLPRPDHGQRISLVESLARQPPPEASS